MKKLIFVILDGAADLPLKELDNQTPLGAAKKPNIDKLAYQGTNGLARVLPIPPESDEAILTLLGYDVFKVYTGRGPIEARGAGLTLKDGQLAIRCSFADAEDKKLLDLRAGDISTSEALQLEKAITEFVTLTDAKFQFKTTLGYRGVLILKSKKLLSSKISNTHPSYSTQFFETIWNKYGDSTTIPLSLASQVEKSMVQSCKPMENTKAAEDSANLVNEFIEKSKLVLEKHPVNLARAAKGLSQANIILTRDAGSKFPDLYNFQKVYQTNWAAIVDMPVEKGIAILAGMHILPIYEISLNSAKDFNMRANVLLRNLNYYDCFYVHIKGTDNFGHNGDYIGKTKMIENIDKYFFGPLLEYIDLNNTIIVVTCDHTTSTAQKAHTAHPVPLLISGADIMPDKVQSFSEAECAQGSLGEIDAINLIPKLIENVKS